MKKSIRLIVAALLVAIMAIGFTACGSGNVDTFAGAISEDSYVSQQEAAEAFLDNEISGEAARAQLKEVKEVGTLSSEEIAGLDTGDALEEGDTIVSAKIVDISYTRNVAGAASLAAEEEDTFVFTVYIIEISPFGAVVHEFRYYVPKAENGDALTRSYFADVLDSAKYVNCTQKYTAKSSSQGISMNIDYVIKCATDKALLEMTMPDLNDTASMMTGKFSYMTIYGYFEDGATFDTWLSLDKGASYVKDSGNSFAEYGVYNMESFATLCLPDIDYSYFEKTSYGFKIQEAFLNKYVGEALGSLAPGASVSASLKYYVKDGRLSKVESKITADLGYKVTASSSITFSAFGTTVVERPATIA